MLEKEINTYNQIRIQYHYIFNKITAYFSQRNSYSELNIL